MIDEEEKQSIILDYKEIVKKYLVNDYAILEPSVCDHFYIKSRIETNYNWVNVIPIEITEAGVLYLNNTGPEERVGKPIDEDDKNYRKTFFIPNFLENFRRVFRLGKKQTEVGFDYCVVEVSEKHLKFFGKMTVKQGLIPVVYKDLVPKGSLKGMEGIMDVL